MSRRRRDWASGLAVLLGLQAAILLVWWAVESGRPTPGTGPSGAPAVSAHLRAPAPELLYLDSENEERRLSGHRGEPVLLHFWATWCAPCVEELPALIQAAERRDLPLLAVSLDEDPRAVTEFFDGRVPEPVAWAVGDRVELTYGLTSLPQTLAVDTEGRLRLRLRGPRDWSDPEILAEVREALQGYPGD